MTVLRQRCAAPLKHKARDTLACHGRWLVTCRCFSGVMAVAITVGWGADAMQIGGDLHEGKSAAAILMPVNDEAAAAEPAVSVNTAASPAFQKWKKKVVAMPAEEQIAAVAKLLEELNPLFDGKVEYRIDDEVLTELTVMTEQVTDISPVAALPGLRTLNCCGGSNRSDSRYGPGKLSDLSPLKGLPLISLGCYETRVSDLSPLRGMPLKHFSCAQTEVRDLSPLHGMPLTTLNCGKTKVADLSPLKGMKLVSLACFSTEVSDLSPLNGMPLAMLWCFNTAVSDLSPLKGIPLTDLYCGDTKVADLSPLKGMPLRFLECSRTKVLDLSPLNGAPLKVLLCGRTQVADLSPLTGTPLTALDCDNTKVHDLAPLAQLPITLLRCDFEAERDARILRSIKTLEKINSVPVSDFWKKVEIDPGWTKP